MKLTKALSLILTLAMLLGTLAIGVTAGNDLSDDNIRLIVAEDQTHNGYYYGAAGSEALPSGTITMTALKESGEKPAEGASYTISNGAELKMFSDLVNSGKDFYMATVYLADHIDMSGITGFNPIGDCGTRGGDQATPWSENASADTPFFRGIFNGRGYSIKNLKLSFGNRKGAGYDNVSLFGYVQGAAIMNLVIDSSCSFTYTGTSQKARTGLIAYAFMKATDGAGAEKDQGMNLPGVTDYSLGALVGANKPTTVANITAPLTYIVMNVQNNAKIDGGVGYAGGIIATTAANCGRNGLVMACTQNGDVSGRVAAGIVGAIIGNNSGRQVRLYANKVACTVVGAQHGSFLINCLLGTVHANGWNHTTGATLETPNYDDSKVGYSYSNVHKVDLTNIPTVDKYTYGCALKEVKIETAEQFKLFADHINSAWEYPGVTVYLANDIDMSGIAGFNGVGFAVGNTSDGSYVADEQTNWSRMFRGVFDGQGHVIDGFTLTNGTYTTKAGKTANYSSVGLFGCLSNGVIRNVVLGENCVIENTVDGTHTGGLVGLALIHGAQTGRPTQVINCYSEATVKGMRYTGGMVGVYYSNTGSQAVAIKNCTFAGTLEGLGASAGIGGMIGYNHRPLSILNNRFAGTATATNRAAYMLCEAGNSVAMSGNVNNGTTTAATSNVFVANTNNKVTDINNVDNAGKIDATWDVIQYIGYQTQTDANGKVTAIRLLATVNSLDAQNVGFNLTLDGTIQAAPITTTTVYGSILANAEGVNVAVQAETLGGKYIVAITINDIPTNENHTITVQTTQDGVTVGAAKDIAISNAG